MSTSTAFAGARVYDLDPAHTSAHFSVRHMMISNVKGEFRKLTGSVVYDPDNPKAASVEARIDAASIGTRDEQRDGHLRSSDFLDVEHFPEILFKSTRIEKGRSDGYVLRGELTIRGVSREVALNVDEITPEAKDPWGNYRVGATASTKIKRSDFGLTWNQALETGGLLVGDEIAITIETEMVRKAS